MGCCGPRDKGVEDYPFEKYYANFFGYENDEKSFPCELKPNMDKSILEKWLK